MQHVGLLHWEFGLLLLSKILDMVRNGNTFFIILKTIQYVNHLWFETLFTQWPLGNFNESLDMSFQIDFSDGWGICCEKALIWMSLDFTDDQPILVQVMAWCLRQQAISWANVDPHLCHHMVSLAHNELKTWVPKWQLKHVHKVPELYLPVKLGDS